MSRLYSVPLLFLLLGTTTATASICENHGDLAARYCDSDLDPIADTPTNPQEWLDPDTIIMSTTPNEDPLSYGREMKDFYNYLESCLNRKVIFYPLQSSEAEIDAMKNGRLHIASFSSGSTIIAVNAAGAVPFAVKGDAEGPLDTSMLVLVRNDSPIQNLNDLKNKRVAHVNPTSNSGHLAALAFLPEIGITPYEDYQVHFTGKHNRSIMGVKSGDYDAAIVASEVLDRMISRKDVARENFRAIYQQDALLSATYSYAHNLAPKLQSDIKRCFYSFEFSPSMTRAFLGTDRFVPINYQEDFKVARQIFQESKDELDNAQE